MQNQLKILKNDFLSLYFMSTPKYSEETRSKLIINCELGIPKRISRYVGQFNSLDRHFHNFCLSLTFQHLTLLAKIQSCLPTVRQNSIDVGIAKTTRIKQTTSVYFLFCPYLASHSCRFSRLSLFLNECLVLTDLIRNVVWRSKDLKTLARRQGA